ncbi:DNA recombination protein RmuC [Microgenomates group bacterium]|nr:DNA recombination protein RmuC [Microgenomates group bacterium]
MQTTIFGLLILVMAGAIIWLLMKLTKQMQPKEENNEAEKVFHQDLTELRRDVLNLQNELNKTLNERLEKNHDNWSREHKNTMEVVNELTKRLTKLDDTNQRVVDVTAELKTIQNVLQNPKQRGTFGEYQLESVLGNVMSPTQYQMQYQFKSKEAVDAVVFLDKGKMLPIDSKFSLENYNRMVEAKNKEQKENYLKLLKQDLKNRIDETSKYIRPEESTMELAFMFVPSESLYYDLLTNYAGSGSSERNLIDYAYKDKKVIIVSPTTLIAYLQTVLQGLRSLQIEEQTKDIIKRVGQLRAHLDKYGEYHSKIGSSLQTVVNHYNKGSGEWVKIDKDVVKIAGGEMRAQVELIEGPMRE